MRQGRRAQSSPAQRLVEGFPPTTPFGPRLRAASSGAAAIAQCPISCGPRGTAAASVCPECRSPCKPLGWTDAPAWHWPALGHPQGHLSADLRQQPFGLPRGCTCEVRQKSGQRGVFALAGKDRARRTMGTPRMTRSAGPSRGPSDRPGSSSRARLFFARILFQTSSCLTTPLAWTGPSVGRTVSLRCRGMPPRPARRRHLAPHQGVPC